ncbi:MAG: hypothetical protein A2Z30_04765 [Chloroflexi bacterium RBG_16_64_43]|nr:MAG: hypothetical protein A2Z30_04765 [Chloroflexi bacterium RBG_16_64_43]
MKARDGEGEDAQIKSTDHWVPAECTRGRRSNKAGMLPHEDDEKKIVIPAWSWRESRALLF